MRPLKGLKTILDKQYEQWNHINFIENDPIVIPHQFSAKEDIEIAAFFTALIAWGNRKSIIKSAESLMQLMEQQPHQFITQHQVKDLKAFDCFVHRTFNSTDLISLIGFIKTLYADWGGLEHGFSMHLNPKDQTIEKALIGFKQLYLNSDYHVKRTEKHLSSPLSGSACKRLNMYLRWMVREDEKGIDFGLWKSIQTHQLVCPLDVHVIRQAQKLQLIKTDKSNWNNAIELTKALKKYCKTDPVKYDFALFGLGILEAQQKQSHQTLELSIHKLGKKFTKH